MRTQWVASILIIAACVGVEHSAAREARQQGPSCLVTTVGGDVQGTDNGASCTFLGVPFAAPPVGALRWKPPQTAAPWSVSARGHDTAAQLFHHQHRIAVGLRGLPEAECLGERSPSHATGAGHRVAPHGRLLGSLRQLRVPQRATAGRGAGRDCRRPELPSWSVRVPGARGARGRGPNASLHRQLRPARSAGGASMGARQHRALRRRSVERDDCRHFGRRTERRTSPGLTRQRAVLSPRDCPERLPDPSRADVIRGRGIKATRLRRGWVAPIHRRCCRACGRRPATRC